MDSLELNINNKKINLSGKKSIIEKEKQYIERLNLTGNEYNDRLIIQKCIDDENLKSDISYCGSTIYSFEKIVKQYRKLQKSDSLENMTEYMYHFFIYGCDDIAHYDIQGFRGYYNNSLRNLENELLKNLPGIYTRNSDIDRIFKELKIGIYFKEREQINIDKISLNTLKSIIKECDWDVSINGDGSWNLSKDTIHNIAYSFNIEVLNRDISKIIKDISYITNSFNKENYIEDVVSKRNQSENALTISEIVEVANNIKYLLSQFSSNILYKSRVAAEEIKDVSSKEEQSNNNVIQMSFFSNNNKDSSDTVSVYSNQDYENDLEIFG